MMLFHFCSMACAHQTSITQYGITQYGSTVYNYRDGPGVASIIVYILKEILMFTFSLWCMGLLTN